MDGGSWRPTASREALRLRARMLARLRQFFAERGVMEVETPLLGAAAVTDPHLASLSCQSLSCQNLSDQPGGRRLYLQTSPEYAMKRLLAAGSGPIYQISKAFRDGEAGRRHNPEFTLLEWYRPGMDHHGLMAEVDDLLRTVLDTAPAEKRTYREVFEEHCGLDPHRAEVAQLRAAAIRLGVGEVAGLTDRDSWLDLLMACAIEPRLGRGRPTLIHDYPASQAALARLRAEGDLSVAERFEVYVEGVELANGYHELTDAAEQRGRFAADLERRHRMGLPQVPVDERLLAALEHGFPDCAGVALGVDRLLMLATGTDALADVLTFPFDRA